ncbi:MAG TPA: helix-turn-helix domain-containing protein [Polyangiaceae bacterium]
MEKLLDAAEARFARHGYEATSLGDIAADVRIRAPSVYKHFESKRDLYEAVLKRLLDPYVALLGGLLTAAENPEHAARNVQAVFDHYTKTPNLARLVQYAALSGGEELDLLVKRWYGPLFARAGALSEGAPRLGKTQRRDVLAVVTLFHAMLSGYVTLAPLHARLLGEDPHGRAWSARHAALLGAVARNLWKL